MQIVDRVAYKIPADLPPRDVWLIDPFKEQLITPVDDRGLIRVDQLIADVKATIDPTYTWPGGLEVHHMYWFNSWYPNDKSVPAVENPAVFRNLAVHKALMPKIFEAWLHEITIPAQVPTLEVRRQRVLSWWTARKLFIAAQKTLTWEEQVRIRRMDVAAHPERVEEFEGTDVYGEAYMRQAMEDNFDRLIMHLVENEEIPPEFRLVTAEEPQAIVTELGSFASKKSLNLTPVIKAA